MVSKIICILLSTSLLAWLILVIRKRFSIALSKRFIFIALGLKILAGIGMGMLYSSYYPVREEADIYKYFDDSKVLYDAILENQSNGWQAFLGNDEDEHIRTQIMYKMNHWYRPYNGNQSNDSHLMIRFNTLMRFISFGHYEVHVIFMSFISLLGLILIYMSMTNFIPYHNIPLLKLLFFVPSILIWSSSVLKEGFVIFALGLLLWSISRMNKNFWLATCWFIVSAIILFAVKFYVFLAFAPGLMAFFWVNHNGDKIYLKYLTTLLFLLGVATNLTYFGSSFDILQSIAIKQKDFVCLAQWVGSGSMVAIPPLDGTLVSTLRAIPIALGNVIFRPWPWEMDSLLMGFAMIENWLFLLTFFYILIGPLKIPFQRKNVLALWVTFIITLFILIGITTPVMGAIVRYKVPAWPFLIGFLCTFTSQNKLSWISKQLHRL